MQTVMEALKSAYGGYRFFILYGLCLIILGFLFDEKRKMFVLPAVCITIVIINPLFYRAWEKLNESMVYWRTLWMLPVLPVCAAVVAFLFEKMKRIWAKTAMILISVFVFALCGGYVYKSVYPLNAFSASSRAEKLPETALEVGDALLELDEWPRVVADSALSTYLRQYSGRIQTPYARSVSYGSPGALGRKIYGDLDGANYDSLAQTMVNYDYKYLATENVEDEKKEALENAGFECLNQIREYGIYQVHCNRTELREYNELGQVISVTQLDKNENPVNGTNGYSTIVYEYDNNGFVTYEFHLDVAGEGVNDNTGKAGYRCERNYRGWVLNLTYLDAEGSPAERSDTNYATLKRDYDRKGHLVREAYYDPQDNAIACNAGFSSLERDYDTKGHLVKETYFDTQGNTVLRDQGYAYLHREYDRDGHIIREAYYDTQENAVSCSAGYASLERQYDEEGNIVREAYYDRRENAVMCDKGYAVVERKYRENKIVEERYQDGDNRPVGIGEIGYARLINQYTEDGQLSLRYFYDEEGDRILCGSGYFHEFLQKLKGKSFVIAVKDEGTKALTATLLKDMQGLGIKTDLQGKYRYSFYAIVSAEGMIEEISLDPLSYSGEIDGHMIEVESAGHEVGNFSSIKIDGTEYSRNARGMNIVVLENGEVTETVAFDPYSMEMSVTR